MVVEGLGLGSCAYPDYEVDEWTALWILQDHLVFTEITPQSGCDSISGYEYELSYIAADVEACNCGAGTYWAGFMLDEEPDYGFTAAQLETLNSYATSLMTGEPGISWWASEDEPGGGWGVGTYNSLLGASIPAPQVYNSSFDSEVNSECATYNICTNLVTTWPGASSPWNSASYTLGQVGGPPWAFGSHYFYNVFA